MRREPLPHRMPLPRGGTQASGTEACAASILLAAGSLHVFRRHAAHLPGDRIQAPKSTEPLWRRRVPGSSGDVVLPCQEAGYVRGVPETAALVADGQMELSWLPLQHGGRCLCENQPTRRPRKGHFPETSPPGDHKKATFWKLAHRETTKRPLSGSLTVWTVKGRKPHNRKKYGSQGNAHGNRHA